ncbi:DUF3341 domain-containing protein [Solitalea koreensis]|uniref:Quinol:cytochrome c oxidoreductase membrane protein n=1 Tax=Solitalea koreensis TaxID=543615 RepID=A0A521AWC4_9SPHI|nr:DUF3341 domain-containing protein [Solitalea koreensis]SMO39152.1 quinol:cytochrome c oxidoreductase membrane protein [Solitalea koreensis]
MSNKKYAIGLYDDQDILLQGIKEVQNNGQMIHDVYTPHPVHGLENVFIIPRSRLPIAAFCFGCLGISCAFLMMWYMITYDWPMDIGGKPNFPIVSFIPILFEWTVLFASFGMGLTFFLANRLIPGSTPRIMDERATDDRYVIAVEVNDENEQTVSSLFRQSGAVEVKYKTV